MTSGNVKHDLPVGPVEPAVVFTGVDVEHFNSAPCVPTHTSTPYSVFSVRPVTSLVLSPAVKSSVTRGITTGCLAFLGVQTILPVVTPAFPAGLFQTAVKDVVAMLSALTHVGAFITTNVTMSSLKCHFEGHYKLIGFDGCLI